MLLDEIIELATGNNQSVAVLLRKCVVLAHQIKNERLKAWANKELNGYEDGDELPGYRISPGQAKGHFTGPFGAEYRNLPIPPAVLEREHRHFATEVRLFQAVSAYEDLVRTTKADGHITAPWPNDLALYYQQRIPNSKRMVLIAAYQEIPKPKLVELVDTVRNRVLNMALELQSEVGETDDDLKKITPQEARKIDQTVIQHIYGGNVYVATGESTMNVHQQTIEVGDKQRLEQVLRNSGLSRADVDELSCVLERDGKKMSSGVTEWIKKTAPKVVSGGVKVGAAVAQTLLTEYLKQYYGLR